MASSDLQKRCHAPARSSPDSSGMRRSRLAAPRILPERHPARISHAPDYGWPLPICKSDVTHLLDLRRIHQECDVRALPHPGYCLRGIPLVFHMLLITDGLFRSAKAMSRTCSIFAGFIRNATFAPCRTQDIA